jgi:hypothetical protein
VEIAEKQAIITPMPLAIKDMGQAAIHRIRQATDTETINPIAMPVPNGFELDICIW